MDCISKTRLYTIFTGMKQRCYNPQSPHYKWYGGKGIAICNEWMGEHGIAMFMEWALNNGYEEHLTIDRIDANGPYCPQNCRWVSRSENAKRVEHIPNRSIEKKPGLNYKFDVLLALRSKGYTANRLRKEKLLSESTIQKLRQYEGVSWSSLGTICTLLECQPGELIESVSGE